MFCSNCGNKLADGAKFCSECGARVASAEQEIRTMKDIDFEEPKFSLDFGEKKAPAVDESPEIPARSRVALDWSNVVDEPRKKEIKDVRSPWETTVGIDEKELYAEMTPSTDRSRTMSFIDLLKAEKAEKEKAAADKAVEYTQVLEIGPDLKAFDEPPKMHYAPLYQDTESHVVTPFDEEPGFEKADAVTEKPADEPRFEKPEEPKVTASRETIAQFDEYVKSFEREAGIMNEPKAEEPVREAAESNAPKFELPDFLKKGSAFSREEPISAPEAKPAKEYRFEELKTEGSGSEEPVFEEPEFEEPEKPKEAAQEPFFEEPVFEEPKYDDGGSFDTPAEHASGTEDFYIDMDNAVDEGPVDENELFREIEETAPKHTGMTIAEPADTESEIEALKKRLAELMGNAEEETEPQTAAKAPESAAPEAPVNQAAGFRFNTIETSPVDDLFEGFADGSGMQDAAAGPEDLYYNIQSTPRAETRRAAEFRFDAVADPETDPLFAAPAPAAEPTPEPVAEPTPEPVAEPTPVPAAEPKPVPAVEPKPVPAVEPTPVPAVEPKPVPAVEPKPVPAVEPTPVPAVEPKPVPVVEPTPVPAVEPKPVPAVEPTPVPVVEPTPVPVAEPTPVPVVEPTPVPVAEPTPEPVAEPTPEPVAEPTPEPVAEPVPAPAAEEAPAPQPVPVIVEEAPKREEPAKKLPSDALSLEDLERDLFGEVPEEEVEAEETKKIDKFYTLYRKNEEFQRLLDEEYDKLKGNLTEEEKKADESIRNIEEVSAAAKEVPVEETKAYRPVEDETIYMPKDLVEREAAKVEAAKAEAAKAETAKAEPVKAETPVQAAAVSGAAAFAAPADKPLVEEAPAEGASFKKNDPKQDKKAAKEAARAEKARKKEEKKLAKAGAAAETAPQVEYEEVDGGSKFLTVLAVIIAIILVILLAVILILQVAPDSGIASSIDSLIENITSSIGAAGPFDESTLL